jgi:hypothetical protein
MAGLLSATVPERKHRSGAKAASDTSEKDFLYKKRIKKEAEKSGITPRCLRQGAGHIILGILFLPPPFVTRGCARK